MLTHKGSLLCLCLCFLSILSFSQNQEINKEWLHQKMMITLQNKVKNDVESIIEHSSFSQKEKNRFLHQWNQSVFIRSRSDNQNITETSETESELHAAVNPIDTNNIIVSGMKWTPGLLGFDLSFPIYFTNNFGQSWNLSEFNGVNDFPFTTIVAGGGDPVIVFDSQGKAFMSWLIISIDILTFETKIALFFASSEDGGQTWVAHDSPIDEGIVGDIINPTGKLVDKEWLTSDINENSAFRDNIYAAYTQLNALDTTYSILVKTKVPNNNTFGESVVVTSTDFEFAQFSSIDVDSDGGIHLLFTGSKVSDTILAIYYSNSLDGGNTFSDPIKVSDIEIPCLSPTQICTEAYITGIEPERTYPCNHLNVDRSGGLYDGNIYAVWTANGIETPDTDGLDIYFSKSENQGEDWSLPIILNDDNLPNAHNFYPSISVNESGIVIITWYDRREDPNNLLTKYYMTTSCDGGETFSENIPVSSESTDFSSIGLSNGNFGIGEYTQVISTPYHAIPFWADGRTNDGNLEIFSSCISLTNCELSTSISQIGTLSELFSFENIFPNPTSNQFLIQFGLTKASNIEIEIVDLNGKLVQGSIKKSLFSGKHELNLNLNNLPSGEYFCILKSDFGFQSKKFSIIF